MFPKNLFLLCIISISLCAGAQSDLQGLLERGVQSIMPQVKTDTSAISYVSVAETIKYWIFAFIGIIAVSYIIAVGAKLLWAPGTEEDTTNAIKSIAYVAVGLAIIPMAYFIVEFIINLQF